MKKYLPHAAFAVAAFIGLALTFVIYEHERVAERRRFEIVADEAVDRIREKVEQNLALIAATHSYFEANGGDVSREEFRTFALGLVLTGKLAGMQGIGFARLIETGEEAVAEAELADNYELDRRIWPQTDQDNRTPIVMLEPLDERNKAALGFDMFSDATRRNSMMEAMRSVELRASAPVELVQEITNHKQAGFLAFLRLNAVPADSAHRPDEPLPIAGFVYAPFRAGDLHRAALSRPNGLPVLVETRDTTDDQSVVLHRSEGYEERAADASFQESRSIDVAGRTWTISVIESIGAHPTSVPYWRSLVLAATSLLFAGALAASIRFGLKAAEANQRLREVSEKTIQEKDLMLQEMKHRIKNSIARILAIARQTGNTAETLDEFNQRFGARLQAMSHAQDLLTRSSWASADLHALLKQELEQVFGDDPSQLEIDGPKVTLDEKTTHALGLVFHELATNAVKYADVFGDNGRFSVSWQLKGKARRSELVLDWIETTATAVSKPEGSGFGTRLIDASIKGELGGEIDREFRDNGLHIRITVPLTARRR